MPHCIKVKKPKLNRKVLFAVFVLFLPLLQNTTLAKDVKVKGDQGWLNKEKVIQRITDNKEILVSVKVEDRKKTEKKAESLKNLKIQCVGLVGRPLLDSFLTAKKFYLLPHVSDHIKKAEYDAVGQELYLHTEAFNYHAHMWMKLRFVEADKERKSIDFEVIRGVFKGMKGTILFSANGIGKTKMELFSDYPYRELPVPNFFVEFGLEVATQRVASKMRSFIENQIEGTANDSETEKAR